MIFHLLIVDDTEAIQKGLSQFINWESLDCILYQPVSNGKEALGVISTQPVDIVITDIRMPEADGLTLIEHLYHHYPDIKVIILTAFADFTYAQAAVTFGVSDFIVKPVSMDKISQAVQKAQAAILASRQKASGENTEHAYLISQLLQEATISPDIQHLLPRFAEYNITLDTFVIAAFQLYSDTYNLNNLIAIIAKQCPDGYCFQYNHLTLLAAPFKAGCSKIPQQFLDTCLEVKTIADSLYHYNVSIGISNLHHTAAQLSIAAREAIHSLSLNFYSTADIGLFSDVQNASDPAVPVTTIILLHELETALNQKHYQKIQQVLREIFIDLRERASKSGITKDICAQIYYIGSRILVKKKLPLPNIPVWEQIDSATNIYELEQTIIQFFDYLELQLKSKEQQYGKTVSETIAYIHKYLATPLSLQNIAAVVHVNASYLSRTFKKETGCALVEYINICRVEKAKELLADRRNLAYEVAEMVGYNEPSYFSYIFKKYTGLSPKEYKAKIQENYV